MRDESLTWTAQMHEAHDEESRRAIELVNSHGELGNCEMFTVLTIVLMRTKLGVLAELPCSRQPLVLYKEGRNCAP